MAGTEQAQPPRVVKHPAGKAENPQSADDGLGGIVCTHAGERRRLAPVHVEAGERGQYFGQSHCLGR